MTGPNPHAVSRWPIFVFLFSAAICLLCSTTFHLFYPMSGSKYKSILRILSDIFKTGLCRNQCADIREQLPCLVLWDVLQPWASCILLNNHLYSRSITFHRVVIWNSAQTIILHIEIFSLWRIRSIFVNTTIAWCD
jgi:hypothetical protein